MFDPNNQYTPNTSFLPPSNRSPNAWGRNNLYKRFSRRSCKLRSHNPSGCWMAIVVMVALALAIAISIVGVSYLQSQPNFDPLNISALLPVLIVVGGVSRSPGSSPENFSAHISRWAFQQSYRLCYRGYPGLVPLLEFLHSSICGHDCDRLYKHFGTNY